MSTTDLEDLSTAMKALSMRRENLYRALTQHTPGSSAWLANDREIDQINESMDSIEAKRQLLTAEMLHGQ
jgi:hypothetical protein